MTHDERALAVFDNAESMVTRLRRVRNLVQKGKHVDPSELADLQGYLDSLRHHCGRHNAERLLPG
jgi:hypothetical protein